MNYQLVGQRIRKRRVEMRLSQEHLAEQAEVSATYISAVENARKRLSLPTLVKIANSLETTPNYFLLGNLRHDSLNCADEISTLLRDCDPRQRRMLIDLLIAAKAIILSSPTP